MNNQKASDEIELRILDEVTKEPVITQRVLADRLDIALGLVNAYIKRLYKKGYIKLKTLPKNRIKYIITPKGFTEKARLTYSYMHSSLKYFKEMRQKIEATYVLMIGAGIKRILLLGDGEIAELCYISTRGLPIEIIGVIESIKVENGFFGRHIYSIEDLKDINYDAVLVSSMKKKVADNIDHLNISPDRVYYL